MDKICLFINYSSIKRWNRKLPQETTKDKILIFRRAKVKINFLGGNFSPMYVLGVTKKLWAHIGHVLKMRTEFDEILSRCS